VEVLITPSTVQAQFKYEGLETNQDQNIGVELLLRVTIELNFSVAFKMK
jgi:hypothetical protein